MRLVGGVLGDDREDDFSGRQIFESLRAGNQFAVGRKDGRDPYQVLRRDAGGEIVITHKGAYDSHRLRRLQARLQRAAPDVYNRFVFLPRTPDAAGYRQRLRGCDVVLDSVHYCGGNTSLEAIASGAPVVTLPSALQRGRHTYGFFRKMRFTETVVQSADEYAALAVSIATDRALAQHLRETQLSRAAALYEDAGAVRQLEDFFERAIAGAGAG